MKWGVHAGAFLAARGGAPFNIPTGQDNNGDTIYNDRPSFATAASNPADVVSTRFGNFDTVPQPGETIVPVNYGDSPRFVSLQVQGQRRCVLAHAPPSHWTVHRRLPWPRAPSPTPTGPALRTRFLAGGSEHHQHGQPSTAHRCAQLHILRPIHRHSQQLSQHLCRKPDRYGAHGFPLLGILRFIRVCCETARYLTDLICMRTFSPAGGDS